MSGCADICLSCDYDGSNEFYSEKIVVARKEHRCCECNDAIKPGQAYERASGKSDGGLFTVATCVLCCEIRKAFCCGGWTFETLWENMREEMFHSWQRVGPYDCLAKLITEAARDKCRTAYAQWLRDNCYDEEPAARPAGETE